MNQPKNQINMQLQEVITSMASLSGTIIGTLQAHVAWDVPIEPDKAKQLLDEVQTLSEIHRDCVFAYLKQLSSSHQEEVRKLREEISRLRDELNGYHFENLNI